MDLVMTQIKKMSEQVKQAMLSHTPIIYIPTNQIELVQEMLYGENCTDAFIPRLYYDNAKKEVTKAEGYNENMLDNYRGRNFNDKLHVPSLFIAYVSEWKLIMSTIQEFISAYWNIKESNTTTRSPETIDNIRRSAYIVVTPTEEAIPPQFAPYTRTIHIPAISDEEIENIIVEKLKTNEIDDDVLGYQLINQMIVCFRGFSANQIGQMLDLMIANQSIDINYVDEEGIKDVIYTTKKQLLASTVGLKWENPSVSGVAGLDNITHWLKDKISIFEDPELARSQHMDIPKGILISGIPGSGKSLMAKTASTLLGMPLISLDMGSLLGGLHGESEHNMINALAMAEKMAPCVLWIDEIEKAFSGSSQHSSSSDGGVGRRMFGKFLTWMQEKPAACFVFATSNDIETVVRSMVGNVDAIYAPTDNVIAAGMPTVAMIANENMLPTICGEAGMCEAGGFATYSIDYTELGRVAGEMAVEILTEGADPAAMPIEYYPSDKLELIVNQETADLLGIDVSGLEL